MAQRKIVYRGETKTLYKSNSAENLRLYFRDDDENSGVQNLLGKGVINNRISEYIMFQLDKIGIATHLVRRENMREQSVKAADVLPIRIKIRNVLGADIRHRLGILNNDLYLSRPLFEFYIKDKSLNCPLVSEDHISVLGLVKSGDLDDIYQLCGRTNDFLFGMMAGVGYTLEELTLEIGRVWENDFPSLILIDEISPDVFTLRDYRTNQRFSYGKPENNKIASLNIYTELAQRLGILPTIPK